jgi:hypothetical protein
VVGPARVFACLLYKATDSTLLLSSPSLLDHPRTYKPETTGAMSEKGTDTYAGTRHGEFVACPMHVGGAEGLQVYVERPIIISMAPLLRGALESSARLAWNHGIAPPLTCTFLGTFSAGSEAGTAFTLSTTLQLTQGGGGLESSSRLQVVQGLRCSR